MIIIIIIINSNTSNKIKNDNNSNNNKNNNNNSNNNKNIVNSYLQYINSFYEKQLNKILGNINKNYTNELSNNNISSNVTDSNDYNNDNHYKQLKFINNELIIQHPLKNESKGTTTYNECVNSITGNDYFTYCGPKPFNFSPYNSI